MKNKYIIAAFLIYCIFSLSGFVLSGIQGRQGCGELFAQTIKTSNQSGNFSNAAIWTTTGSGGFISYVILSPHTVTLNAIASAHYLTIESGGTLDNNGWPITILNAYTNNGIHNGNWGSIIANNANPMNIDGSGITNCDFQDDHGGFNFTATCHLTVNGNFTRGGFNYFYMENYGYPTINGNIAVDAGSTSGAIKNNSGVINQTGNTVVLNGSWVENYAEFNISGNLVLSDSYFYNGYKATIQGDLLGAGINISSFFQTLNAYAKFGGRVFPNSNNGDLCAAGLSVFDGSGIEPNTVEYNGVADQSIKTPSDGGSYYGNVSLFNTYSNLILSNRKIKSLTASVIIKGDLTIRDSARFDVSTGNYSINLFGNWTDTSKHVNPFIERTGKVRFSDTSAQSITASPVPGGETFYNLIINNSDSGVVLINGNINVSDTLTLSDGLIHTGLDTVWVSNMDTAAIQSYSDSTYVNGYLKRSIYPNTSSSYDFPVGNARAFELANVNFNGTNTTDALTVNFSNSTGTSGLSLSDANDAQYNSLLNCGGIAPGTGNVNEGVWNIRPADGSAIYDLTLYARHHSNQQIYHSIVKRNSSIAPWEFAGTYLAASGTEPLIAHRTCLLDFYQFAIASSNTNTPLVTTPLSFFSPDNMICGSKCIDFTGKSILSATKWRWTIAGGVFANAADTLQNPSNICFNTTGNYDVRLIASTACHADTLPITQYIKVNPIPTITISGETSICSGKRTVFSDTTSASTLSYLWSTGSTGQGINVIPFTNTTYSVETSNGFCKDTTYIDVNVTTSPTVSITANTSAICSGENVFITSSAGSGVIADNYLWSNGESGNAITVSPTTTQTYSLTLSNGICAEQGILTINVTTQPTAIITGETTICSGKRNVLSATSTVPGINYLWNTGDTGESINASSNTSTTYSVVLSNGICKDTANVFITVTTTPSITLTANKTIVCSGENLIITGTGTGTYLWSTGASTNIINTTALSSQKFALTLSNFNCFDKDSISITVIPMPTASISGSSTICAGSSSSFTATGGDTYLWNTGETTASITKIPLSNTTYSLTVSNGKGLCIDTASRGSTLINPISTDAGPDITMAIGLDTVLSTSNGTAWNWSPLGRLHCYTCQSTVASPLQTTNYIVTVTDINGCIANDSITIFIIPCATLFIPKAFSPNNDGQNDVLYIRGTDCIEKVFSFTIFNRWGEKVFETTDIKAAWDGSQTRQTLPNEVFIYHLDALSITGDAISKTGNVTLMR